MTFMTFENHQLTIVYLQMTAKYITNNTLTKVHGWPSFRRTKLDRWKKINHGNKTTVSFGYNVANIKDKKNFKDNWQKDPSDFEGLSIHSLDTSQIFKEGTWKTKQINNYVTLLLVDLDYYTYAKLRFSQTSFKQLSKISYDSIFKVGIEFNAAPDTI